MKPFFQHLRIALIAIIVPRLRSQRRSRNWKFIASERRPMTARDGTSPSRAKGSFSVLLPIPFNDFTTNDATTGETSHAVGAKSSEGIKFSAVELAAAASRCRTSIQFQNRLRQRRPTRCRTSGAAPGRGGHSDIDDGQHHDHPLHALHPARRRALYTFDRISNAHRELVAANKDKFFESSNSRRNPDPGRSGSLTGL